MYMYIYTYMFLLNIHMYIYIYIYFFFPQENRHVPKLRSALSGNFEVVRLQGHMQRI